MSLIVFPNNQNHSLSAEATSQRGVKRGFVADTNTTRSFTDLMLQATGWTMQANERHPTLKERLPDGSSLHMFEEGDRKGDGIRVLPNGSLEYYTHEQLLAFESTAKAVAEEAKRLMQVSEIYRTLADSAKRIKDLPAHPIANTLDSLKSAGQETNEGVQPVNTMLTYPVGQTTEPLSLQAPRQEDASVKERGAVIEERLADGSTIRYVCQNGVREGDAIQIAPDGTTIDFTYLNGKREGKAKETCPGSLITEFTYKDDLLEGDAIERSGEGTVCQYTFKQGIRAGDAVYFSPHGMLTKFKYREETQEDPGRTFPDGLIVKFTYVNGVEQGEAYETSPKEDQKLTFRFKNGIREGAAVCQFPDGSVEKFRYKEGVRSGPASYHFSDGTVEKYTYQNGKREGDATIQFAKRLDGKKRMKATFSYKNGNPDGRVDVHCENGTIARFLCKDNEFQQDNIRAKKAKRAKANKGKS